MSKPCYYCIGSAGCHTAKCPTIFPASLPEWERGYNDALEDVVADEEGNEPYDMGYAQGVAELCGIRRSI